MESMEGTLIIDGDDATSAKALVSSETGPDSELARWGNLLSKDSVNLGMETDTGDLHPHHPPLQAGRHPEVSRAGDSYSLLLTPQPLSLISWRGIRL